MNIFVPGCDFHLFFRMKWVIYFAPLIGASPIADEVFPNLYIPSIRSPATCERNACLSTNANFCSETVPGIYRILGVPCTSGVTCTDCSIVGDNGAVLCKCEFPPNRVSAQYGEPCNPTAECVVGSCFRPCETFYYLSECPLDRCGWDYIDHACIEKRAVALPPRWNTIAPYGQLKPSELLRAQYIVNKTSSAVFPLNFDALRFAVHGYLIGGKDSIESVIPLGQFFSLLDVDNSGEIDLDEFKNLPIVSQTVFKVQTPSLANDDSTRQLTEISSSICVVNITACNPAAVNSPTTQGSICQANGENLFYCPLTDSCTFDCSTNCGWLNTENFAIRRCVFPTLSACVAVGKYFCSPDNTCVENCLNCSKNHTISDSVTNACRTSWWGDTVSYDQSTWTCRYRKSSNQACLSDMDCVYGKRVCEANFCVPKLIGEECASNRDCHYLEADCQTGQIGNFSMKSTCQPIKTLSCESDSQCNPFSKCNLAETPFICREMFSLSPGTVASSPDLCNSGSLLFDSTCSEFPTKSKRLGQSCSTDSECPTTDTSRFAVCACKGWWSDLTTNCKICQPVEGDSGSEYRRSWLYVKATFCGNRWSDEECLKEQEKNVALAYYTYMCEIDSLLPSSSTAFSEGCPDPNRVDYCAKVLTLGTGL